MNTKQVFTYILNLGKILKRSLIHLWQFQVTNTKYVSICSACCCCNVLTNNKMWIKLQSYLVLICENEINPNQISILLNKHFYNNKKSFFPVKEIWPKIFSTSTLSSITYINIYQKFLNVAIFVNSYVLCNPNGLKPGMCQCQMSLAETLSARTRTLATKISRIIVKTQRHTTGGQSHFCSAT